VSERDFPRSTGVRQGVRHAADRELGAACRRLIDALDWAWRAGIGDPRRVGLLRRYYCAIRRSTPRPCPPTVFACIVDIFRDLEPA